LRRPSPSSKLEAEPSEPYKWFKRTAGSFEADSWTVICGFGTTIPSATSHRLIEVMDADGGIIDCVDAVPDATITGWYYFNLPRRLLVPPGGDVNTGENNPALLSCVACATLTDALMIL